MGDFLSGAKRITVEDHLVDLVDVVDAADAVLDPRVQQAVDEAEDCVVHAETDGQGAGGAEEVELDGAVLHLNHSILQVGLYVD